MTENKDRAWRFCPTPYPGGTCGCGGGCDGNPRPTASVAIDIRYTLADIGRIEMGLNARYEKLHALNREFDAAKLQEANHDAST